MRLTRTSLLMLPLILSCAHKSDGSSGSDDDWGDDGWGDEGRSDDTPIAGSPGSILGRVCSPNGRHWLPDAMAYANLIDEGGPPSSIRFA